MDKLLLIDIGGTHIRHAVASADSNEITNINKELFSTSNFENIVQELIQRNNIDILIISAAGPKKSVLLLKGLPSLIVLIFSLT